MKHKHRPLRIRYANWLTLSVGVSLLAVACGAEAGTPEVALHEAAPPTAAPVEPGEVASNAQTSLADLAQLEGSTFVQDDEDHFISPMMPLDGIAPVYEPQFVTAVEATYLDEEMVIGVEIDGEAKAYPITLLNRREMVNDELGGTPILVSW